MKVSHAIIYLKSESPLSNVEVQKILKDPDKDKLSYVPPSLPRNGEVYVFSCGDDLRKVTESLD